MRNYYKMLALKYRVHGEPGPINGDMFCWAANMEQLHVHISNANEALRIVQPGITWTWTYPTDPVPVYWMLNKLNFGRILNGGNDASNAQYFWNNTRLNLTSIEEVYFDQTQTEEQGSPRATFPDDLGTDGQRLKENEATSKGSALNYIAKLALTFPEEPFTDYWTSLNTGVISTKEALAAVNLLLDTAD